MTSSPLRTPTIPFYDAQSKVTLDEDEHIIRIQVMAPQGSQANQRREDPVLRVRAMAFDQARTFQETKGTYQDRTRTAWG